MVPATAAMHGLSHHPPSCQLWDEAEREPVGMAGSEQLFAIHCQAAWKEAGGREEGMCCQARHWPNCSCPSWVFWGALEVLFVFECVLRLVFVLANPFNDWFFFLTFSFISGFHFLFS